MDNTPVKVGIIGTGNMGGAFAKALSLLPEVHLFIYDRNPHKCEALAEGRERLIVCSNAAETAARSDLILLAVKPQMLRDVLRDIAPRLTPSKTLLSIAVGVLSKDIAEASGGVCPSVRIMPNTPLLVGEGVFALVLDDPELPVQTKRLITNLLQAMGKVYIMQENKIDAFSAVVGSGPGFMYLLWQAFEEAAVALGFPRKDAREMALATAKGSALLAEQSGSDFYKLYEMVASPGGTTIAGAMHLERTGVKGHIADAVMKCHARAMELAGQKK
ncbi:MAG: pyrroline-5-carboxylate reductase [Desulfovibrionaceae bacterium]|nr:pyrroline-5-carboxylate reductase [Desulfovibrionaceae bacterium]